MLPSREQAVELWKKYNTDDNLWKHALAVEAAMRHFAELKGGNPDEWGVIGLIHDLDYQQYPSEHCAKTKEILEAEGWPEYAVRAVMSHGWTLCTDVEPLTDMEKTLFAVDELTGFVIASALVRPSKSVQDLELKSVKKKWKDKAFAAGVDRAVVEKGAALMGIELDALITEVIQALRKAGF